MLDKILPRDNHIGYSDLIGILEKRLHDEGLKFVVAFFGAQGRTYLSKIHPEWSQIDYLGKPKKWYNFSLLCPTA